MESISRPGSPTATEYNTPNPTSRPITPGPSPLLPRPGTPNAAATSLDPAWDFQKIDSPRDGEIESVVDDLARMKFSDSQANAANMANKAAIDLQTAVRNVEEAMASLRTRQAAYPAPQHTSDPDFFAPLIVSYEQTRALIRQIPSLLTDRDQSNQDSCLHAGVKKIRDNPNYFIPLISVFSVFLELGADREAVNSEGRMPIELALDLDMPILVELLSGEAHNKEELLVLACKHNYPELMQWLTKEPPAVTSDTASWAQAAIPNNVNNNNNNTQEPSKAALSDAKQLADKIYANPTNVYERIKELYETHKELCTAKFGKTGDTVMHRAVDAFVHNHVLGIFELLVLLELKANKNARNYANKTPLDLAKEANIIILVQLLEHPEPTIEVLTNLAIEHGLETLTNWTLN